MAKAKTLSSSMKKLKQAKLPTIKAFKPVGRMPKPSIKSRKTY